MTQDFPYAAVVQFDDLDGLQAYLQHPAHEALGAKFHELTPVGLIDDYEMEGVLETYSCRRGQRVWQARQNGLPQDGHGPRQAPHR